MADALNIIFQVSGLPAAVSSLSSLARAAGGGGGPGISAGQIAGLAASITALGAAAAAAARYTSELAQAQTLMNSSMRDTVALAGLGGAAGTDFASAAAALRQQANFTPLGRMAAGQLGIPFAPFDLSEAHDTGRDLITAIREARKLFREDPQALLRDLRNLPALQPFANIIKTPQNIEPFLDAMTRAQEKVFSPQTVTVATEFSVQFSALLTNMKALGSALAGFILPGINTLLTGFNLIIARLIEGVTWLRDRLGLGGGAGGAGGAAAAHTSAVRENTEAIRYFTGTFGGGRRAAGAIPGAFSGGLNAARDGGWAQLKGHASRLGAYSIGM